MTHNFNRAVLLLATLTASVLLNACKDDNDINKNDHNKNKTEKVGDNLYMVTTYNVVHEYFKPKKAAVYTKDKDIWGNWYANEKISSKDTLFFYETFDSEYDYAEHFFFLDEDGIQKYVKAGRFKTDPSDIDYNILSEKTKNEVMINPKDIISPYKEYAAYYGDTTHLTYHNSGIGATPWNFACVLPVTAIDVVCNKDFDADHPAGSKLNDILYYNQWLQTYEYLKDKNYQGEPIITGKGSMKMFEPRKLSEFNSKPLYLMESEYQLTFDHSPSAPGTYEFTVKFTFGEDPLTGETVDIAPAKVSIDF